MKKHSVSFYVPGVIFFLFLAASQQSLANLSITSTSATELQEGGVSELTAVFSGAFIPNLASLELRRVDGMTETVVPSRTLELSLEGTLSEDQLSAVYQLGEVKVGKLLQHMDSTDFKNYLILSDGTTTVEKEVLFTGDLPALVITTDPFEALLEKDTPNSLAIEFSRTFKPNSVKLV